MGIGIFHPYSTLNICDIRNVLCPPPLELCLPLSAKESVYGSLFQDLKQQKLELARTGQEGSSNDQEATQRREITVVSLPLEEKGIRKQT